MLAGLGHDPLIGCDHHDNDIDPGGAGHHIFYKFFVPGYIHNPQMLPAGQIQCGKAQLDGNAALFFFF
jgi:hypothetical protein